MLRVFSEYERAMICARGHAGIDRAKANGTHSGKPIGRPPVSAEKTATIKAMRAAAAS
jgi:DNA invertase Pin-like site-specific DNA recombinase